MANLIIDNAIMTQSILERLKAGKKQDAAEVGRLLKKQIATILVDFDGNIALKNKAEKIIKALRKGLDPIIKKQVLKLEQDIKDSAIQLSNIEYQSFSQIFNTSEVKEAEEESIYQALDDRPLSLKNWSGQLYLSGFIAAWGTLATNQIVNSVTQTFAEGGSVSSLVGLLYSDKDSRFNVISKIVNDYDAIASTALQHAHSVAASTFYSANPKLVKSEEFAAILDSQTSVVCRSLDGTTYPVGVGPRPPLHFRCRSRMLPVINGKYLENLNDELLDKSPYGEETYYQWLARQSSKRQNIVLGPTRGKLFRDGGLTSEQFANLQLHKNFKPMTLEEMKQIVPDAFKKAKIN